jgi:hypothetical protein
VAVAAFIVETVSEALERSLRNAKHLRARDAGAVAAARALAKKIDAWDVIVGWALEDAVDKKGRPAVPQNDNVSIASFLKYLDALGLITPTEVAAAGAPAAAAPPDELASFRKRSTG